jgi:integrase
MEPFFRDLHEIFQRHGNTAARSGKEVSFATRHLRRDYVFADFYRLRTGKLVKLENGQVVSERRFKLPSPYGLKQKHIRALANDWVARGNSIAYVHNKLSVWRVFCSWIGKPDLVPPIAQLIGDPTYHRRSQLAVRDKSWSGCGIDITQKLAEIAEMDPRAAMVLELMWVFSLRLKEASLLCPHLADAGAYLDVCRGTKAGRRRVHPINTPAERATLESAKALVTDPTGCLIPKDKNYKQWQDWMYYLLRKHGVTYKQIGTSTHGLRHEGLNRLYEEITGAKSPVRGGQPGEVAPETDHFARAQVAEVAGHSRPTKAGMYLGAVVRGHKPAVEVAPPPSVPAPADKHDETKQLVGALRDQARSEEEIS